MEQRELDLLKRAFVLLANCPQGNALFESKSSEWARDYRNAGLPIPDGSERYTKMVDLGDIY